MTKDIKITGSNPPNPPIDRQTTADALLGRVRNRIVGNAGNDQIVEGLFLKAAIDVASNITNVPPDGSVTTGKIADGAVTSTKLDRDIAIDGSLNVAGDTIVSSGNVGIGTASPDTMVHLKSANSPRLRLQDTTNSVKLDLFAGNNASLIGNTSNHDLTFATNDIERMRIDSSGSVLVGTSSVQGRGCTFFEPSVGSAAMLKSTGTPLYVMTNDGGSGAGTLLSFYTGTSGVGTIETNGTSVSYNTTSDYRLKENITYDWDATTRLNQLKPARFNFIADGNNRVDGFLAHEAAEIVPEAVTGTKDAVDDDGNPMYQGIDQAKIVPLLVKTVQELEARITALETS